ncbi:MULTISPECIES: alpha/beta hydrolase [Streptomyces]|uniref:alpha/beta hydrolase n=1 Tax=Streptomyces TaxID=1883 RepID=UPI0005B7D738|nr:MULTISPECIES: alpha/beta fold hydrolase [Streptomyces]
MPTSDSVTLRTLDGLHLAGTLVRPDVPASRAVVLVHGGGVTREEGGFFTRLAAGMAGSGVASLRFDMRGHGESEGRQEELTLAMILNDIRVAISYLREATSAREIALLGASFGGGICAYYAAKRSADLSRLVLFNPQLDYKWRTIDTRAYWVNDSISEEAAQQLTDQGFIQFTPTLRHGRPLFNEVFWFHPHEVVGEVRAPTLIVHGTEDTFVPIGLSRNAVQKFRAPCEIIEIEGAQHGFAVHDDPQYLNPQSQEWQKFVIRTVSEWLTADSSRG